MLSRSLVRSVFADSFVQETTRTGKIGHCFKHVTNAVTLRVKIRVGLSQLHLLS
jgi:hypothetical protein